MISKFGTGVLALSWATDSSELPLPISRLFMYIMAKKLMRILVGGVEKLSVLIIMAILMKRLFGSREQPGCIH